MPLRQRQRLEQPPYGAFRRPLPTSTTPTASCTCIAAKCHPIPSAANADLQYVQSQGTPLVFAIWGGSKEPDKEAFALLWDAEKEW